MPAVVIVILILASVVVLCAVGVETLRRYNRPSIQPLAPRPAEVHSWAVVRAFGSDSQSVEIANLWFSLSENAREELLFYGRGLVSSALPLAPPPRASGVTSLTPVSVDIVPDRQSSRPTALAAELRATVAAPEPMFCAICEHPIDRNESVATDGHNVKWHPRCLSQASEISKKTGAQR